MFSKREYEYVMEIAKEGSFSKAAQKLYISQPALSGAIKKIEKELYGISLFDRNVNPVALTPAGQYYLEKTRKIYELSNEMEQHFAELAGIRSGVINIRKLRIFLCVFSSGGDPGLLQTESKVPDQRDGDGYFRDGCGA